MDDAKTVADHQAAGTGFADALRLDGNAAGGILSEIFVPDVTAARVTCAQCGAIRAVGALHMYAHGMGTVLRCPGCEAVMLCVARTATQMWVDWTGVRRVVIGVATGGESASIGTG